MATSRRSDHTDAQGLDHTDAIVSRAVAESPGRVRHSRRLLRKARLSVADCGTRDPRAALHLAFVSGLRTNEYFSILLRPD